MRKVSFALAFLAVLAITASALVFAQDLSKLPADVTLPKAADSPGPVVFSHQTHMAVQAKPDCTVCHPKLAPIVKTKTARRDPITHAKMEKGLSCGSCHDGKAAHGFEDCSSCHRS
jgi:c(7)-type cytochrome triheme protein